MSTTDDELDRLKAQDARHVEADLAELEGARRMLRSMGVPDLERMTVAAGIGLAMTGLMRRHSEFMSLFGQELVQAGVSAVTVNECAESAGLAMLRRSWEENSSGPSPEGAS